MFENVWAGKIGRQKAGWKQRRQGAWVNRLRQETLLASAALLVALAGQPATVKADNTSASSSATATTTTSSHSTPAAGATPAPAKPTAAPSGKTAPAAGGPQQLDTVVVQDVPVDANILPTRPTDSVYGLGETPQDTPRSIYQVSKDQLKNDPISSANDLARYSPSVSNYSGQGIAGAPYIRGQAAEVYEDGIRESKSNVPFNVNAYESLDIVTGPASVIFGPSVKTSGYIDWQLKAPDFSGNHTEIDTTFGKIDSGRSFPDFTQTVDNTGPLSKDVAYRVSLEQSEANQYYHGANNDFSNIYAALSWQPTTNTTIDADFDWGSYNTANVRGWNRVTQDLIDNGIYTGGNAVPVLKSSSGTVGYYEPVLSDASATPASAGLATTQQFVEVAASSTTPTGQTTASTSNYYYKLVGGGTTTVAPTVATIGNYVTVSSATAGTGTLEGWVLRPADAVYTKVSASDGLQNAADELDIRQVKGHFDVKTIVNDELTLVDKTYYEHDYFVQTTFIDASLQGDKSDTFENRLEAQLKKDYSLFGLDIEHDSNSGIDIRAIDDISSFDIANYFINPYNMTGGSNFSVGEIYGVPDAAVLANSGSITSPGWGKIATSTYAQVNGLPSPITSVAGGTTDESQLLYAGLYSFHDLHFGDQWTWSLGGRGTFVYANVDSPVDSAAASAVGDNTTQFLPNVTSSLSYKPVPWVNTYLTYNYLQAVNENSGAGGVGYSAPGGGGPGNLSATTFHSDSSLFEAGSKFTFVPDKLYGSIAGYYQERTGSPVSTAAGYTFPQIIAHGVESSVDYQATRNFKTGVNYSWIEANYSHFNPNTSFSSPYGVIANGTTVFSATSASPTDTGYPVGNYHLAIPNNRIDAFASYQFDSGLGFSADFWFTTAYETVDNVARVPDEHNIDLGVFYQQPRWRAQVDFLNITNQTNFSLVNSDTAENLVPLEPFGIQGKLSVKF